MHHVTGPSWQSERDGSPITAKETAESPRPGTIPELLLTVDAHTGGGVPSDVAYINPLLTSDGVAPYGAVYVFWAAKR
ncbi:hypothetical protein [Micromonospora maritima]|uniref:Uncharacterized protein n=1 Tax=Micromonospora maritima TaxID=986711 RepID=A0ABW7ZGM4_9ACTN